MKLIQFIYHHILLQSTTATVEEDESQNHIQAITATTATTAIVEGETQYLLSGENRFDLNPVIGGAPHAAKIEPVPPTEDERNTPEEELNTLETPSGE